MMQRARRLPPTVLGVIGLACCGVCCRGPRLTALDPARGTAAEARIVRVSGVRFRAPLEVAIGSGPRRPLFIARPTLAEAEVDALPPGSHDIAIYDRGREVSRLRSALMIEPAPPSAAAASAPAVWLIGTMYGLTPSLIVRIEQSVGQLGPTGVMVGDLGPAEHPSLRGAISRRAALRVPLDHSCAAFSFDRFIDVPTALVTRFDGSARPHCGTPSREYQRGEIPLQRAARLMLATAAGPVAFGVDAVRPPGATPSLVASQQLRLVALLTDENGRAAQRPPFGSTLFLSETRRLGVVVSGPSSRTAGLVVEIHCERQGETCAVPATETQPAIPLRIGTPLTLRWPRGLALHVLGIRATDEPASGNSEQP